MFDALRSFFHKVAQLQKRVFTWIFLHCIYGLGIGLTAIIARIFGFRFIERPKAASSWKVHGREVKLDTMY